MTESSSMKDWQLEESSGKENQWQLLDTEQELPAAMKLQEGEPAQQEWQPVEYIDDKSGGRRNWILPSFIIIAMVAVVGYIAWLGFSGVNFLPTAEPVTEAPAPVEEPLAVQVTSAPTEEPAAVVTPVPAAQAVATVAPVEEPTPTDALVEQAFAQIASEYGLNARPNASTEGDPIRLLDNGLTLPIVQQIDSWVQLELEDGVRAWVSSEFISITKEFVPLSEAVGFPSAVQEAGATEGTGGDAAAPQSTGIQPPEPFTDVVPNGPAVLVLAEGGVNARTAPDTDGSDIILTIPQGAALQALAQNEGGDWLQVELPSGTLAWVFLEAVDTAGPIESLAALTAEGLPVQEAESGPAASTDAAVEETVVVEEVVETAADPQITIDSLIGIKARSVPELDGEAVEILTKGTTTPAIGRTADSAWIQVQLPSGDSGWVLVGAVQLNVDPAELPVVEP